MNIVQLLISKFLTDAEKQIRQRPWFHDGTPTKHPQHKCLGYTHNHGKSESKIRRKMAAKSRKINRGKR